MVDQDERPKTDPHSHIRIKQADAPATVKIVSDETGLGYMIINKSDFDKKVHKLYAEKGAE